MKRWLVPLLCLTLLGLAPGAARATQCAVPADDAARADIAGWMAQGAGAAGLPGELPVMASLAAAGLHNVPFGDADAVGYFAMRTSIWNSGQYLGFPDHPALQLKWFIDQALAVKGRRIAAGDAGFGSDPAKWGEWIADVMLPPSQLRGQYQPRLDEARQLIAAGCAAPDHPLDPAGGGGTPSVPGGFSIAAATPQDDGAALIALLAPGPGRFDLLATATAPRTAARARRITVARISRAVTASGRVTLKLKPSRAARAILRRKRRLRVTMKITFSPAGGTATSRVRTLTLKLKRR